MIEANIEEDRDAGINDLSNPEITDGFVAQSSDDTPPPVPEPTGPDGTYSQVIIYNKKGTHLSLAQVEVFNHDLSNIARDPRKVHSVWQSDTRYGLDASRAVDGNISGDIADSSITFTTTNDGRIWRLAFKKNEEIKAIRIYNRTDCCMDRLDGASMRLVSNGKFTNYIRLNGDRKQTIYLS